MIEIVKRNMRCSSTIWTGKGRYWSRALASQTQSREQVTIRSDDHCLGCDAWVHVENSGKRLVPSCAVSSYVCR